MHGAEDDVRDLSAHLVQHLRDAQSLPKAARAGGGR
jgi:hypothetical protein